VVLHDFLLPHVLEEVLGCFTAALLLLYCCFTAALLLLLCVVLHDLLLPHVLEPAAHCRSVCRR
jgi:hypothetical protein